MCVILAYLAGCMDSDGYFGIRKSTYGIRKRKDCLSPTYNERMSLKQVKEDVPKLLQETFGGHVYCEERGGNSKSLWVYGSQNKIAYNACVKMLPYLRVKKEQAELLIKLRETKGKTKMRQLTYWFEKENPNWEEMEMITHEEVMDVLGYSHISEVSQAIRNNTLLSLPYRHGKKEPRVPKKLVYDLTSYFESNKLGSSTTPQQLLDLRDSYYLQVKELNRIGVNGTAINRQSPLEVDL